MSFRFMRSLRFYGLFQSLPFGRTAAFYPAKAAENPAFLRLREARDRPGMRDFSLDNPAAIRYYREVASGEAGF